MLRWGLSFAAACAVALALFVLMLGMVTPKQASEPEAPLRIADYVPFADSRDTPSRSRQPKRGAAAASCATRASRPSMVSRSKRVRPQSETST